MNQDTKRPPLRVVDSTGTSHVFNGEDVRFYHEGHILRVYHATTGTIASFTNPICAMYTEVVL